MTFVLLLSPLTLRAQGTPLSGLDARSVNKLEFSVRYGFLLPEQSIFNTLDVLLRTPKKLGERLVTSN
jgi:hypothetical protein